MLIVSEFTDIEKKSARFIKRRKGVDHIVYTEQLLAAIQAWQQKIDQGVVNVSAVVGYLSMTIGGDIFALQPYDELRQRIERLVVYERVREEFLVESLLIAFTQRIDQLIDGHHAHQLRLQQQLSDAAQQSFHAHAANELCRLQQQQPSMQALKETWANVCEEYFDDVARVELRFQQLATLQPEHEAYYKQALLDAKKSRNMFK